MKKHLLLAGALLTGVFASAQITYSDAPAINDGATMYVLDSNLTSYSNITGSSAIWDYSSASGYSDGGNAKTATVTILDATTTSHAADYPTSTHCIKIEGVMSQFYTDSASGRLSQGFVFEEPTLGEVVGKYDSIPEKLITYPFAVGDQFTSTFYGHADAGTFLSGLEVTGGNTVTIDGKGTLKLGQGKVFNDVLRYKLVDTMNADVTGFGQMQMIRTQYEYYKPGNSITGNLPLFIHVHLAFGQQGGAPMMDQSVVLSAVKADAQDAGINENMLNSTAIYPNPATNKVTISLPKGMNGASITITDGLGRSIMTQNLSSTAQTVNISDLNKGLYFVRISNGTISTVKRLIVK